jgi:hypothetical protein
MPRFAAHRLPLNGGMHGQTWAMLEIEAGPCGAWGGKRYTGMNPTKSNLGKPKYVSSTKKLEVVVAKG